MLPVEAMSDIELCEELETFLGKQDWRSAAACADRLVTLREMYGLHGRTLENFIVACKLQLAAAHLMAKAAENVSVLVARLKSAVVDEEGPAVVAASLVLLEAAARENELTAARVVSANALVRLLEP